MRVFDSIAFMKNDALKKKSIDSRKKLLLVVIEIEERKRVLAGFYSKNFQATAPTITAKPTMYERL